MTTLSFFPIGAETDSFSKNSNLSKTQDTAIDLSPSFWRDGWQGGIVYSDYGNSGLLLVMVVFLMQIAPIIHIHQAMYQNAL